MLGKPATKNLGHKSVRVTVYMQVIVSESKVIFPPPPLCLIISAYTCAKDLKFSPDPDQTKTRKMFQLELVQVLYGLT